MLHAPDRLSYELSFDQARDRADDARFWAQRADELEAFVREHMNDLQAYIEACEAKGFLPDNAAYDTSEQLVEQIQAGVRQMRALLASDAPQGEDYWRHIVQVERIYRSLLLLKVPAVRVMSWGSAAYRQSVDTFHFYDRQYGELGERLNYDRIDSPHVQRWRKQMKQVLGAEGHGIVALASGTAAFTLLMNYLTQEVLAPGFTVYVPRVVYGETDLMLREDSAQYKLVAGDTHSTAEVLGGIKACNADMMLVEGMRNALGNPLMDVRELVRLLNETPLEKDLHLLVDDTLLTGAYVLADLVTNPRLKVYQYFSTLKYLQLGMDAGFSAALIVPLKDEVVFRKRASLLGLVLYDSVALTYPVFDREQFLFRQRRMTRNALVMAQVLNERFAESGLKALYPLLDEHPQLEQALQLPFVGCLLTLDLDARLKMVSERNLAPMFSLLENIVEAARRKGVSIAMRESFGLGAPCMIVPWCKRTRPYVRISAGDRSLEETVAVAHVMADELLRQLA